MPDKRNPHQRVHYRALSAVVDGFVAELNDYFSHLSDAQLRQAEETVQGLTTTNCGWTIYESRELIASLITLEIGMRLTKKIEGDRHLFVPAPTGEPKICYRCARAIDHEIHQWNKSENSNV